MKIKYEKIFVIGFNKTATSTFQWLFQENDLRTQHVSRWDVPYYTCFADNGDRNDFKKLDENYPNSLFILNVRPLRDWLISRFKHGLREKSPNWAHPYSIEKCNKWFSDREKHHGELLSHFQSSPDKLIVINTNKPSWQNYVADFIGLKKRKVRSRNIHATKDDDQDHINILNLVDSFFASNTDVKEESLILADKSLEDKYLKRFVNNFD